MKGKAVLVDVSEFYARSLKRVCDDFSEAENTSTDYGPLSFFYCQQGYLTVFDHSFEGMSMRVPNKEINSIFLKALTVYLLKIWQ